MLSDDEVKSFLSSQNLKLTKKNSNPRPFDQKLTMDNLYTVAKCISEITKKDKIDHFTKSYIWKHDVSDELVKIYGKGSVYDENKKNEYDKFFAQPMNLLSYFGVLSRDEKKIPHRFKILDQNVLSYIHSQSDRSLKFLVFVSQEFAKQNNLSNYFNDFFSKETSDSFKDLRTNLDIFIRANTNIGERRPNPHEPSRIYNKIINHLAYDLGKKGSYGNQGAISHDTILLEDLQYNSKNWHDHDTKKPKDISRAEWRKLYYQNQEKNKKEDVFENGAKRDVKERHKHLSEYSGEKANHAHHIFPKGDFPDLRYIRENIILITSGEHLDIAHPMGNVKKVDKKFQINLLIKKLESIIKIINGNDDFYNLKNFIKVLNTGFNEQLDDNASENEIKDFLIKRLKTLN